MKADYQILACKNAATWRQWLADHQADTDGLWLRLYKKASGVPSVTYAEALDQALCFGWIDGQRKSYDEQSYLQKFTPRRKTSLWSKRNIQHVARLTQAGLMAPAGMAEVERAQLDGRWDAAYDSPSQMLVPDAFLAELHKHPGAQKLFEALSKTNKYAIAWQLQTAKTEVTRQKRQAKILAMLQAGEKSYI